MMNVLLSVLLLILVTNGGHVDGTELSRLASEFVVLDLDEMHEICFNLCAAASCSYFSFSSRSFCSMAAF